MKEISVRELTINPCELFDVHWGLVAVGNEKEHNAMTISWGSIGVLWSFDVISIYIRNTRYTKSLLDKYESFSVSFFEEEYKAMLVYMGRNSGFNEDKFLKAQLKVTYENKAPLFNEAKLTFICQKLYSAPIHLKDVKNRIEEISDGYGVNEEHFIYVGKIEKVLTND